MSREVNWAVDSEDGRVPGHRHSHLGRALKLPHLMAEGRGQECYYHNQNLIPEATPTQRTLIQDSGQNLSHHL